MPRSRDDDDDRPRRRDDENRRRRDDDDDRPRRRGDEERPRSRRRDEDDDDRPRSRRRDEDDDGPRRGRRGRDDDRPRKRPAAEKRPTGAILAVVLAAVFLVCGGIGFMVYRWVSGIKNDVQAAWNAATEDAAIEESETNLGTIGHGINEHSRKLGYLPNNTFQFGKGEPGQPPVVRPLLSWRVHILPYLGEDALYREFRLQEPWDSPHNIQLLRMMPSLYGTDDANARAGPGKTYYRGFWHKGGVFDRDDAVNRRPIAEHNINDGTNATAMVIESGEAVEWTKPDDIDMSEGRPTPPLGGVNPQVPFCLVLMANGTLVRKMRKDTTADVFHILATRNDGKRLPPSWEFWR